MRPGRTLNFDSDAVQSALRTTDNYTEIENYQTIAIFTNQLINTNKPSKEELHIIICVDLFTKR